MVSFIEPIASMSSDALDSRKDSLWLAGQRDRLQSLRYSGESPVTRVTPSRPTFYGKALCCTKKFIIPNTQVLDICRQQFSRHNEVGQ